jgi:hypothetical protein
MKDPLGNACAMDLQAITVSTVAIMNSMANFTGVPPLPD